MFRIRSSLARFWLLAAALLLAGVASCADAPDTADSRTKVENLIAMLGNPDFDVRDKASAALKQLGPSSAAQLEQALEKAADPEVRQRLNEVLWQCAPLQCLAKLYTALDLPIAMANAELVRYPGPLSSKEGRLVQQYHLGFVLQKRGEHSPAIVLTGTLKRPVTDPEIALVPVNEDRIDTGDFAVPFIDQPFPVNHILAAAIQCELLGRHGVARTLLDFSLTHHVILDLRYDHAEGPADLRTQLCKLAWAHWGNEFATPIGDRTALAQKLRALIKAEKFLDTAENREFMASVEATLAPRTAPAGSIEALIDGLTEAGSSKFFISDDNDAHVQNVLNRGFDAIPALIAHLDDIRLTRGMIPGMMNSRARHRKVQDVVRGILSGYGGGSANVDTWNEWSREWWEAARKTGEERYLLDHIFPGDPKNEWPLPIILSVIAARYPQDLPRIYLDLLDNHPKLQSGPLCECIAHLDIPREKKIELFLHATQNANLEHRRLALRKLKDLDEKLFAAILIQNLNAIPKTPEGAYWNCREAAFVHLVMESSDPMVWAALLTTAKRVDAGLRMEFLNPMDYAYFDDRQRPQRLDFLAAFLDDEAVREGVVDASKLEGPSAGFTLTRLEVRNLAAMEIGSILKIGGTPDASWTAAQWSELRGLVRKALQK